MRARSTSTQRGLVVLALAVVAVAGSASAVHAEGVPGLSATVSTSAAQLTAGESLQVTATFTPSLDAGATEVGIDLLGAVGPVSLTVTSSSAELTSCAVAALSVTCAWDEQAGDGPQTLAVDIAAAIDAAPGTWTVRALGAIAGTPAISLAEASVSVAAAAPPAPTTVPESTTPVAETTTTTVAPTTVPPPETTAVVTAPAPALPIEQAPVATPPAAAVTTTTTNRSRDDLPTTGTDSDRSVRMALAIMVGGLGLVMLARRDRPASNR